MTDPFEKNDPPMRFLSPNMAAECWRGRRERMSRADTNFEKGWQMGYAENAAENAKLQDTIAQLKQELEDMACPDCTCYETFGGHQPGCLYHSMTKCKECGNWYVPIKEAKP
jgi:hypothetical protein